MDEEDIGRNYARRKLLVQAKEHISTLKSALKGADELDTDKHVGHIRGQLKYWQDIEAVVSDELEDVSRRSDSE